jgi:hypothetical protein
MALKDGHVKDKATLTKIKSWHELITSMKVSSTLHRIFQGKNENILNKLFRNLKDECEKCEECEEQLNSLNSNSNKYPHFSPQALFI